MRNRNTSNRMVGCAAVSFCFVTNNIHRHRSRGIARWHMQNRMQMGEYRVIPGELIHTIGTSAQPQEDTSEPGVMICLCSME